MLLIPTRALKTGMAITQPVFHPRRDDVVLLAPGFVLTSQIIDRLAELQIKFVWIDFPDLDEVDRQVNARLALDHMMLYQELRGAMSRLKHRVALEMNVAQYRQAIQNILIEIVADPDHQVLTNNLAQCGEEIAGHMANCCYMALLLGAHMSGYLRQQRKALPSKVAEDTHRLGLGAMLHDIGKGGLPEELREKTILDPESDLPEYRYHTVVGYEQVKGQLPATAAHVVLNHHQRYDGSGFPDRIDRIVGERKAPPAGQAIHIFCRIVGLVDAFDRLLSDSGKIRPTVCALANLLSARFDGWFDPMAMSYLVKLVPPFMVGSIVRMNNGTHAVVIGNHTDAPCRPTVRCLSDSVFKRGVRVQGKPLDLRLRGDLFVSETAGVKVADAVRRLQEAAFEMVAIV